MADVFISYAREDRATAGALAGALEARGWSVWWDPKIRAGAAFDRVIEQELDGAAAVVVLWSRHSAASEWVQNEATAAAERGVLVPARIEEVRPPLAFRRHQAADLVGWSGDPASLGYQAVADAVEVLVGAPARAAPAPADQAVSQASRRPSWRALGGMVVAVLGAAVVGYSVSPREAAEPQARPAAPAAVSSVGAQEAGATGRPAVAAEPREALPPSGAGVLEFAWPGDDCWKIFRGDVEAKSSCGAGRHALQAGSYLLRPSSSGVFVPFTVVIEAGRTARVDASAGTFEFRWPGDDCWTIHRGDVAAKSSCGGGKHALQAGSYTVKPSSSAVFAPMRVEVTRGRTTTLP